MNAIQLRRDGPVARLLINQPTKRNALNRDMWCTIATETRKIAADESIRVMTIESAEPGMFAAGADISEFEANYCDADTTSEVNAEITNAIESVANCPQPTLALIDGPCVGGSVALVLACDIRLSSDAASYSVTPARLGLSYHPNDLRRLISTVGRGAASELLFGSMRWPAGRALQAGLVNTVTSSAEFTLHCQALVEAICANSVAANRVLKQSMNLVTSGDPAQFIQAERKFTSLFSSEDFAEGRDAFLEKRAARFPSHNHKLSRE